MKRSSSITEIQPIEWRDWQQMEHDFYRRCQPVRSVLDSLSIRTTISTVLNTRLIKWSAARCRIRRVQQWLSREQVVKGRMRPPSTILWESLSRKHSICMSLISWTIEFNFFDWGKWMEQRWLSMEWMEQQSHCRDRQEWCWMEMDTYSLLILSIIVFLDLIDGDFDVWRVVRADRVQHPIS